jgi:hypothetical protein
MGQSLGLLVPVCDGREGRGNLFEHSAQSSAAWQDPPCRASPRDAATICDRSPGPFRKAGAAATTGRFRAATLGSGLSADLEKKNGIHFEFKY